MSSYQYDYVESKRCEYNDGNRKYVYKPVLNSNPEISRKLKKKVGNLTPIVPKFPTFSVGSLPVGQTRNSFNKLPFKFPHPLFRKNSKQARIWISSHNSLSEKRFFFFFVTTNKNKSKNVMMRHHLVNNKKTPSYDQSNQNVLMENTICDECLLDTSRSNSSISSSPQNKEVFASEENNLSFPYYSSTHKYQ
ncbi:hypothetical protein QTN25_003597 [Entamoeba marina]